MIAITDTVYCSNFVLYASLSVHHTIHTIHQFSVVYLWHDDVCEAQALNPKHGQLYIYIVLYVVMARCQIFHFDSIRNLVKNPDSVRFRSIYPTGQRYADNTTRVSR